MLRKGNCRNCWMDCMIRNYVLIVMPVRKNWLFLLEKVIFSFDLPLYNCGNYLVFFYKKGVTAEFI